MGSPHNEELKGALSKPRKKLTYVSMKLLPGPTERNLHLLPIVSWPFFKNTKYNTL
jgi:hypothetical protein